MPATETQAQAEQSELAEVLRSDIFQRSPSLARFLKYVCEQYFDDKAEDLKEYAIALAALGRNSDFDQKKDAIVRVEAHRLRRRLAEYYRTVGADHLVRIEIPNGQYGPHFIWKPEMGKDDPSPVAQSEVTHETALVESKAESTAEPPLLITPVDQPGGMQPPTVRSVRPWLFLLAACLAIGSAITLVLLRPWATEGLEVWQGSSSEPVASEYRLLPGYHGPPVIDRQGRTWQADAYYRGGHSLHLSKSLSLEALPHPVFGETEREGEFQYAVPERPGSYEVHLYFADDSTGSQDSTSVKQFRVFLNDKIALDDFDVISDAAGPHRLTSRVFRDVSPLADGCIHLQFRSLGRAAMLTALEILWSKPGTVRPVRIVAAPHSVTDPDGSVWMADEYATGGMVASRLSSIQNSELKPLFAGERFGNFSYRIPAPPGRYRARLFFAETYFGSKMPYSGKSNYVGVRVFNVFTEGQTLLRNFDLTKEAGGPNRAVVKTFDNLEPNAQGKIVLDFVPVKNYAEVNAIEITQLDL